MGVFIGFYSLRGYYPKNGESDGLDFCASRVTWKVKGAL